MTLELPVIDTDDETVTEAPPEKLALPLTESVDDTLAIEEILPDTEGEPVIEGDPVTDTVLEPNADELNDTEPVVVIVVETDDDGGAEDDTLEVMLPDPLGEPLDVKLANELEDIDVDALVQPEDETLPD